MIKGILIISEWKTNLTVIIESLPLCNHTIPFVLSITTRYYGMIREIDLHRVSPLERASIVPFQNPNV